MHYFVNFKWRFEIMAENSTKFLSKSISVADDQKTGTVKFELGNGKHIQVKLSDMPAAIVTQLALHGLSQKIGDSAAGFSKDKDYAGALEAMTRVANNLVEGKFNGDREGNSREDLIAAIAKIKKVDVEVARRTIDKATKEQIETLQKHPAIKAEIAKIKADRLAKAAEGAEGDLAKLLKF